jgi:uncharacterized protein YndB with AHSA1/START domain
MAADSVTATVHINAPPERVWEYFTKPDAIMRWMGEYVPLEPEPGGQFTVNVQGAPVRGRFLSLEPPHRLVISWGYAGSERLPSGAGIVEIWLTPDGAAPASTLSTASCQPPRSPGTLPAGLTTWPGSPPPALVRLARTPAWGKYPLRRPGRRDERTLREQRLPARAMSRDGRLGGGLISTAVHRSSSRSSRTS